MNTRLMQDLLQHLASISTGFNPKRGKVVAHLAGGTAVNFYTDARMSDDMDIEWSHRVLLSMDQQSFMTEDADGDPVKVSVDAGFSDSIGLFHPDWKDDATVVADLPQLTIKVISPVDLIVSKIGRFIERDRDDIRLIASHMPIDPEEVRVRAEEALDYYIGNEEYIRTSIKLAIEILEECRNDDTGCKP